MPPGRGRVTSIGSEPDGLTPESRLLLADLHRLSEELAYENAPVECRTSIYGLSFLHLAFGGARAPVQQIDLASGLRVIVDPTVGERRIEFRDRAGKVVKTIELP